MFVIFYLFAVKDVNNKEKYHLLCANLKKYTKNHLLSLQEVERSDYLAVFFEDNGKEKINTDFWRENDLNVLLEWRKL